ncbi:MAG: ABC transporter permease [Candidatus Melainabacteria bacterium]|jgi:cell division transport system permease protein|uniref:Cell division protein FtsX n=1 Tax=Candidatus Obscuribacter phosphatis TaxID=1906157 RepID=A0A8J7P7C4_9BACT|nr:ABC transporter permease [Candidatus Obscuribacter phosphatis]MCA0313079.1 ABC transporter permease [Candidatus Melainabacteria bacterium]
MLRAIRIFNRVCVETLLGLRASGWSNWLVVSILAIALTIFGCVLQVTMTLKNLVNAWGNQIQISAYLAEGADPKKVAHEISRFPEVKQVEIVTKDVAWNEMQHTFKVASIENPLPNTLHVKLSSPDQVEVLAPKLRLMSAIENVRYPLKVAKKINDVRHFLELAGLFVTTALSAATLVVIGNTIHLVIKARHKEIEILSLMGVGHLYIKCPFVFQGAVYGACAAIMASVVLVGLHLYIDPYVKDQLLSLAPALTQNLEYSMGQTAVLMAILGVVVGAGGSLWTSGRYIKI